MPSIRSVTRKPPTTLIVPKAIAITSRSSSRKPVAGPISRMPPSTTMPWIALVPDISGVCSVFGTFEMTSKPTNAARTRIASSVSRSTSDHLSLAHHAGALDHFVVEVEAQLDETQDVARVQRRRVLGHPRRQVQRPGDLDAARGRER